MAAVFLHSGRGKSFTPHPQTVPEEDTGSGGRKGMGQRLGQNTQLQ